MSKGNFACPACGSTSTYVRKRDGKVCCKTCGYDKLDDEIEAVRTALAHLQQAEDDDDGIPPEGEEKRYYPILVPDDLPPVDEVQISFDGGKTVWVFVASRLVPGDDE